MVLCQCTKDKLFHRKLANNLIIQSKFVLTTSRIARKHSCLEESGADEVSNTGL